VSRLLARIEAIAADVENGPRPSSQPSEGGSAEEALAARLEAAFDARLVALNDRLDGLSERLEALGRDNAAEAAALREDLADALEELGAGLVDRLSAIQADLAPNPAARQA
jgi:hypothetical protein